MLDPKSNRLITAKEARQLCGGISEMTEWRWRQQFPDFPKPRNINGRKYYRLGELQNWLDAREVAA
jgi:predicted DNA-binding transcriptional regulator AlpA